MSVMKNPFNFGPESINELAEYISTKGKFLNTKDIKEPAVRSSDADPSFILSKLSDKELIKLLAEQPHKTEYDLNDLFQAAMKDVDKNIDSYNVADTTFQKETPQKAFFRLEQQEVTPSIGSNSELNAFEKISSLLHGRAVKTEAELGDSAEDDIDDLKREKLFDLLVVQLKSLCCKSNKKKRRFHVVKDKSSVKKAERPSELPTEHMFLILNDEVNSNATDGIITVDPDSLEKNSSVLLLGPITSPLSDSHLELVMNRISNELEKPEYLPILNQLASGLIRNNDNLKLVKHLVAGPHTRRYIKPHRCNHQSKLARVYGGPKWLICTGYINLNNPSIYD